MLLSLVYQLAITRQCVQQPSIREQYCMSRSFIIFMYTFSGIIAEDKNLHLQLSQFVLQKTVNEPNSLFCVLWTDKNTIHKCMLSTTYLIGP
jgi:hypothetical protein